MEPGESMCKSLLKWLQKITPTKTRSVAEACDGVGVAGALVHMVPEHFSKLEAKIKRDVNPNNWRLRVSNLKKVLEAVAEYYQEVLSLQVLESGRPDVVRVGEAQDQLELEKLLRLVLGVAINCDRKQEYITTIMEMEEVVQRNIMQAIQQLEEVTVGPGRTGLSLLVLDSDTRMMKLVNDLEAASKSREALVEQIQQLEQQLQTSVDEKQEILKQNEMLQKKQNKNLEETARKQIEQLKEEVFRAEVIRDDFKAKMFEQEKEILTYQEKISELQLAAQDYTRLKDEMDALSESASKVPDLELALASYKKRLENYQDIKRNLLKLEEKNMEYLQKNMELEEELSKNNTWKTQCEAYKNKVIELQQKLDDETQKSDKAHFNLDKMKAKLVSLQGEKERLILERDSLRDENEELKLGPRKELSSAVSQELSSTDVNERLRFLERENRALKHHKQELEAKQSQLDSVQNQAEKLQQKNRLSNQTVLKLEAQIEELKCQQGENTSNSSIVKEYRQKVINLQEALTAKENELQASQARYNRNLEKAREVAQILDLKLIDMDMSLNRSPVVKEIEDKLFHKLSMNCHREAVDERLMRTNSGQKSEPRGSSKFKSK